MEKTQLRKTYLEIRDQLKPEERARYSATIRQRVQRHTQWEDADTILTYVSFRSEVDTQKLIQEALEAHKRIVVPITNTKTREMTFSELQSIGDLHPGAYEG